MIHVDSNLVFSANSVNENVLKIAEQNIDELPGIPLSELGQAINMGRKTTQGILAKAMRKINSMFKSWVLFVLQGNPGALKFIRQAFNELKNSMINGNIANGTLAVFQKRGGALTAESRTELLNNWN